MPSTGVASHEPSHGNAHYYPPRLAESLKLVLALDPHGTGQQAAERELVQSLQTGVGVAVVLMASHSRPFSGELAVSPMMLLQVMPKGGAEPLTRACGHVSVKVGGLDQRQLEPRRAVRGNSRA